LVGEVDCSVIKAAPICHLFNIQSFPTILYGDPLRPNVYEGAYDKESLSKFAQEHLHTPVCHIHHQDACDEDTKNTFAELSTHSEIELQLRLLELEDETHSFWKDNIMSESDYNLIQQVLQAVHGVDIDESPFKVPDQNDDDDFFFADYDLGSESLDTSKDYTASSSFSWEDDDAVAPIGEEL
jgi:hypothetical protein